MASTNFVNGVTKILAAWLNEINSAVFNAIGSGGTPPTTPAQVLGNIGAQPVNAKLTAFSGLTGAADKVAYFTGASAMNVADFTTVGRAVAGAADDAAGRAALLVRPLTGSLNLRGNNNSSLPFTKMDFTADAIVYRDATGTLFNGTAFSVVIDTQAAGPVANGRDQAGAFANDTWLHFYAIRKPDGTQAGIVSTTFNHTTGPALPTGYTHWCYLGAVFYAASTQLRLVRIRGSWIIADESSDSWVVLSAGTATSFTNISLTAFVPPNALLVCVQGTQTANHNAANLAITSRLRSGGNTGNGINALGGYTQVNGISIQFRNTYWLSPGSSTEIAYVIAGAASSSNSLTVAVLAYTVPNGAN